MHPIKNDNKSAASCNCKL